MVESIKYSKYTRKIPVKYKNIKSEKDTVEVNKI